MYFGRMRAERSLAVDLANIIGVSLFGHATGAQINEFIRTGRLDASFEAPPEPYDADHIRRLAAEGLIGRLR